jgi:hypothetical protein
VHHCWQGGIAYVQRSEELLKQQLIRQVDPSGRDQLVEFPNDDGEEWFVIGKTAKKR